MSMHFLYGALALALGLSTAQAADQPLKIGIEAAYPPFASKSPTGEITGFDYDIGNALCVEMQIKCVWVEQEYDGLIPALKVKKVDAILSSMSITQERKKSVDFTDKYYQSPARLAMKKGVAIDDDLSGLQGKRIGVQRSSIHDRFATDVLAPKGVEIVRYTSQNEIYLDMNAGRLDGTVADQIILSESFLKLPTGQAFAFAGPQLTDPNYFGDGIGIALRKGDALRVERFNEAIKSIRAKGIYQAINAKYFDFDVYGK
ncbi:ABC transporter substrate-binding protein [Pseudomonas sp. B21-028]|uniref:ABC transporter substrate-binding protein n=1 Tax=Pseudomonas TaxID=286 RepID=UPI00215EDA70|nr:MULTISPECIES: ABC transporter substrate-binding protein [Pseudomonas]UVL86097.1 ABC transporter substrate-binding protein [Pseudomonas sp. B21-028]UVM70474.1 ABC transporter substrate-binding protein [Pseudomonas canavaninivorans]